MEKHRGLWSFLIDRQQTDATMPRDSFGSTYTFSAEKMIRRCVACIMAGFAIFALCGTLYIAIPVARAQVAADERANLEDQLKQLEAEMAEHEQKIAEYRRSGASLQNEIGTLTAQMKKIDLQIKSVTISLKELDKDIQSTQQKIGELDVQIDSNKDMLRDLLQQMREADEEDLLTVLLRNPELSDFFGKMNDLVMVEDSAQQALVQLAGLHKATEDQKDQLVAQKTDAEELKILQERQKKDATAKAKEKTTLLTVTKGKESAYQKLLAEAKKKAAEIKSRIYQLQGGADPMTFGQAYDLSKIAAAAAKIREAFILAVMTQESGANQKIGGNIGRCYYNGSAKNAEGMVMRRTERTVFEKLMAELGKNPAETPVSCPILSDGSYGGAMGPSQFMPSTWNLYKNRIMDVTGANPPSPFSNLDAMAGTALYLEDAYYSDSCSNYAADACRQNKLCSVEEQRTLHERCAAAKYYAGANWYKFRWAYGESVVQRANDFQNDIDVISGN